MPKGLKNGSAPWLQEEEEEDEEAITKQRRHEDCTEIKKTACRLHADEEASVQTHNEDEERPKKKTPCA